MVLDSVSINKHLELLRGYVADLIGLRAEIQNAAALRGDRQLQARVLFALQMAIQNCIAIAGHIIAELSFPRPEERTELFTVLADKGILTADLAEKMRAMTRFRNLIVHMYWTIDYDRVYSILETELPDFNAYENTVVDILSQYGP